MELFEFFFFFFSTQRLWTASSGAGRVELLLTNNVLSLRHCKGIYSLFFSRCCGVEWKKRRRGGCSSPLFPVPFCRQRHKKGEVFFFWLVSSLLRHVEATEGPCCYRRRRREQQQQEEEENPRQDAKLLLINRPASFIFFLVFISGPKRAD